MTTNEARAWIIKWSLMIVGSQMVFLLVAPAIDFPIEFPQNLDLLQIIGPVFLGYLGSASHFLFRSSSAEMAVDQRLLSLLLKGPIYIYVVAVSAATAAFWYSNRQGATIGEGMSVPQLATSYSIVLGLLAVTTSVIISYLFATDKSVQEPVVSDGTMPQTRDKKDDGAGVQLAKDASTKDAEEFTSQKRETDQR